MVVPFDRASFVLFQQAYAAGKLILDAGHTCKLHRDTGGLWFMVTWSHNGIRDYLTKHELNQLKRGSVKC